jgi:hypothetical protein
MACSPFLRWTTVVLILLHAATALAEPYTVETVGFQSRADAEAARTLAAEAGLEAEVVRSFRKGRGWVFLVRVQGIEDREIAASTARSLAELSGTSVQVFLVAGRDVLPVEDLAVAATGGPGDDAGGGGADAGEGLLSDDKAARAEGARLLSALVLAHGGGGAQTPRASANGWDPIHFRFERRVDLGEGAMRAWHDYWRAGEKLRLEVRVMEGEGRNSVTIVDGDHAWLWVDGELHEVAAGPTREAVGLFAPDVVLEQAVSFATWTADGSARSVQPAWPGEELAWVELEREQGEPVLVGLDMADQRVRELILEGDDDALRWSFADYQEMPGSLLVPLRLESHVGERTREQVVVRSLEAPEQVEPSLFDPEALKSP